MMKISILTTVVHDHLLHIKIFKKLDIRPSTIEQSFHRSITDLKPRGKSHHKKVLKIIAKHLNVKQKDLLCDIQRVKN
jgi:hypothetical protein